MRLFIIILLTLPTTTLFSQENSSLPGKPSNSYSINIELGGYREFGSVFNEQILFDRTRLKTSFQAGLGIIGVPVFVNEIYSFGKHNIEAALGVVLPFKNLKLK